MTDEEWREHRAKAVQVGDLGLCSVLSNGTVKIEGHVPVPIANVRNYAYELQARHRDEFNRFLTRNGVPR